MADEETKRGIISRKEAEKLGLKRFFTGKSCKHGHVSEWYTLGGQCVECTKQKVSEWRSKNIEKVRRREREYYASHPEWAKAKHRKQHEKFGDILKEKARHRYASDPERARKIQRRSYAKNAARLAEKNRQRAAKYREMFPEKARAAIENWWAKNPGRKNTYHRNRRARKRGNGGSHTTKEIEEIFELQNGKCALCRRKLGSDYHVDHIIPLIRGGLNDRTNLQILCQKCNLDKAGRDPIDHARSLGMLL